MSAFPGVLPHLSWQQQMALWHEGFGWFYFPCFDFSQISILIFLVSSSPYKKQQGCFHVEIKHPRLPPNAGQTLLKGMGKLLEGLLPAMSQSSASEAFAKASSSSGSRVTLSSTGSIGFCLGTQAFPANTRELLATAPGRPSQNPVDPSRLRLP